MSLFSNSSDINTQLNNLRKHLKKSKDLSKEFLKLQKLVNAFISEKFGVAHKFTYEDLKFELKEKELPIEVKDKIEILCDDLGVLEFDKEKVNKENLDKIISELIIFVSALNTSIKLKSVSEGKKHGLFSRVKKKKQEPAPGENPDETNLDITPLSDEMFAPPELRDAIAKQKAAEKEKVVKTTEPEKLTDTLPEPEHKGLTKNIPKPDKLSDLLPDPEEPSEVIPVPEDETEIVSEPETIVPKEKPVEEILVDKKKKTDEKVPVITETKLEKSFNVGKIKQKPVKKIKLKKSVSQTKKAKKSSELPFFESSIEAEKFLKIDEKQETVKENLNDLISSLQKNKTELKQELKFINTEENLLKKEKKIIQKKESKELPEFKLFNKKLDDEITELEHKKQAVLKREKLVNKKLISLKDIETKLTDFSKNIVKDNKLLKKKTEYLNAKEKVIKQIRDELNKKYGITIKEIEDLKKDLKEKEQKFTKLQLFFNSREKKLSVEEANLLNEKRRHAKLVSNLLDNHKLLAEKDLEEIDKKINESKERIGKSSKRIIDHKLKLKNLKKETKIVKEKIANKKLYFKSVEKEFKSRDPKFASLAMKLDTKKQKIVDLEPKLSQFEQDLNKTEQDIKKRKQSLELKELDLTSIEKDINRIKFKLKNSELRVQIREKQLEKRLSSFVKIRKDIKNSIAREKRAVKRIEDNLTKKGVYVSRELGKFEELDKGYDHASDAIFNTGRDTDLEFREVKFTHLPKEKVGNPNILDILRLLNIAKDFIRSNQTNRSRDTYLQIV